MKKSINRLLACFLAILLVFLNIPIAFVVNATGSRPIGADTQTNAANQKWAFIPVVKDSATWYKIKGVSTGLVLTIEGTSSGSYVKESADLGSDDTQLWEVTIVAGNLWSWGFYGNAIKPKLADQGTTWPTFLTCSDAGVLTISTAGWGDNIEQSFQLNGSCINIWDVAPNNAPNPGVAYTISRKKLGTCRQLQNP